MHKIDLHLHTTASDGSDTPNELLKLAKEAGLTTISITDHDTLAGCIEALKVAESGIKVITGIEFSCRYGGSDGFDCHILGYGFDLKSQEMLDAIAHGRQMRLAKLESRIDYLNEHFGIRFNKDETEWLYSLNSAAKPHLAGLIVKHGLADSIGDAIDKYLKGHDFPDDRIDAGEAIKAIISAGGIPVYAHPIGGEREKRLTESELLPRVDALAALGLMGLECYYSRYSTEDAEMLSSIAKNRGLLVSAGSDYHGKNKTIELGRLSSDEMKELPGISILPLLLNR